MWCLISCYLLCYIKCATNISVLTSARSRLYRKAPFAIEHGENTLQLRQRHAFEFSVKWQPLKCILISLKSAECYALLRWDCLCHFRVFPLSHETTSYLFHSKSVNIIVSKSHVVFSSMCLSNTTTFLRGLNILIWLREQCLFRHHNQIQIINRCGQENEEQRGEWQIQAMYHKETM